jgi:transcription initiation factor IIE alpha subunit
VCNLKDLNSITYYLEYKLNEKYKSCEICDNRFKLKSANSPQKYCNKCKKEVKIKQNKDSYDKLRKK